MLAVVNRAMLSENREIVLGQIAEGMRQIAHQQDLIARLRRDGQSTHEAEGLLRVLQATQTTQERGLAQIESALASPANSLLD